MEFALQLTYRIIGGSNGSETSVLLEQFKVSNFLKYFIPVKSEILKLEQSILIKFFTKLKEVSNKFPNI